MSVPTAAHDAPGPARAGDGASASPMVSLRGLVKRWGERTALRGIDLEIGGAGIVGVVGPDGAGKTTLLRSLAGLLEVEARQALVLGFDLRGDVTDLKAALGYVPQVFSLYRDLSIAENLEVTARLNALPADVARRRRDGLLERTGLAPFLERQAGALSGGMKQKLAIVSALLPEPRLLLLDEPTAGVDVVARDEIWSILDDLSREVLVVVSTSYLEEVSRCGDLVYLDGGRIIARGSPEELRASVPLELYRAWGPNPRGIAQTARTLDYVDRSRAAGSFARVEVRRDRSPGTARVVADLLRLRGAEVAIAEPAPVDTESMMLALARGEVASPSRPGAGPDRPPAGAAG